MSKQPLKIVQLTASNIKKLVAVDITPDGNMVEISGRNGAGKTSVLDAIWWALGGTKNVQGKPIRDGEEEAVVELNLGPVIVRRKFIAKDDGGYTTSIVVENDEGLRYSSPQSILDAIVGDLTFDPLAFTRMKPPEQMKTLQGFVKGFDFDAATQSRKQYYVDRRDLNRDLKQIEAQMAAISDLPEGLEVIDLSTANSAYREAVKKRQDIASLHEASRTARNDAERIEALVKSKREKIAEIEEDIRSLDVQLAEAKEIASGDLPALIDLTDFEADVKTAQEQTSLVAAQNEKKRLSERHADLAKQAEELTAKINEIDAKREAAITSSKMPVKGIGFGEDCVTLSGVPFDQGSDAEQLRAAIEIAVAMNPRLRICRVRDGSLIDAEGMVALSEYADKHDFQIWIERVDSSGKSGIVIENGEIKNAETPQQEAA